MTSIPARIAAGFAGTVAVIGVLAACAGQVVIPVDSARVSGDGMTLELDYDACTAIAGAAVQEFTSEVEVYLLADRPATPADDCKGHTVTVLKAPLGDRVLKDPYTGKVIPVSTTT